MKITWKHGDRSIEFEHRPMTEGRFRALCSLALAAVAGGVLLGLVHMLGVWGHWRCLGYTRSFKAFDRRAGALSLPAFLFGL